MVWWKDSQTTIEWRRKARSVWQLSYWKSIEFEIVYFWNKVSLSNFQDFLPYIRPKSREKIKLGNTTIDLHCLQKKVFCLIVSKVVLALSFLCPFCLVVSYRRKKYMMLLITLFSIYHSSNFKNEEIYEPFTLFRFLWFAGTTIFGTRLSTKCTFSN